jgi:hypothetical protein
VLFLRLQLLPAVLLLHRYLLPRGARPCSTRATRSQYGQGVEALLSRFLLAPSFQVPPLGPIRPSKRQHSIPHRQETRQPRLPPLQRARPHGQGWH